MYIKPRVISIILISVTEYDETCHNLKHISIYNLKKSLSLFHSTSLQFWIIFQLLLCFSLHWWLLQPCIFICFLFHHSSFVIYLGLLGCRLLLQSLPNQTGIGKQMDYYLTGCSSSYCRVPLCLQTRLIGLGYQLCCQCTF